ncbi:hypothetical protein V8J88_17105 [Massilia sp. W12]|uniref:Tse2 family ADP-ribosyltransferase toxin n=1 Tax=Massilia sp. W12 TaxID=3126507 RepID=UPI0030D36F0C
MSQTDTDFYRSVLIAQFPGGTIIDKNPAPEVLYPDFEPRVLPDGRVRDADIEKQIDKDGSVWVKSRGGTSLFDKDAVFPRKKWTTFHIPNGTEIPDGIIIRFTGYNKKYDANHYQIESKAGLMRIDAYKGALDNLARNAIARAVELGKTR